MYFTNWQASVLTATVDFCALLGTFIRVLFSIKKYRDAYREMFRNA